jgi:hypothetical protein
VKLFCYYSLVFSSLLASSSHSSVTSVVSSISTLAGADTAATTSSLLVSISNFSLFIHKSLTLIISQVVFSFDRSTSNHSTKSVGKHFTSISFICSSRRAHSFFTAFDELIK